MSYLGKSGVVILVIYTRVISSGVYGSFFDALTDIVLIARRKAARVADLKRIEINAVIRIYIRRRCLVSVHIPDGLAAGYIFILINPPDVVVCNNFLGCFTAARIEHAFP